MISDKDIEFVAGHYREGLFKIDPALKQIKGAGNRWWSFQRIAVASMILIVLSAAAAIIINSYYTSDNLINQEVSEPRNHVNEIISSAIDFDDVPLTQVIDQIELVYNVEIIDIPANPNAYRLSIHYEGNATDLIETINEILGTQMKIKGEL